MDARFDENDWEEARRALADLGLTDLEVKVARLVARNRKNERIAKDLGVPISKVKWTLRILFIKLGVTDRHDLAEFVAARLDAVRGRVARPKATPAPDLRILKKRRGGGRRKPSPPGDGGLDSRAAPP